MFVQLNGYGKQFDPNARQVSSLILRHTRADPQHNSWSINNTFLKIDVQ